MGYELWAKSEGLVACFQMMNRIGPGVAYSSWP
jgi:hypothetical protein